MLIYNHKGTYNVVFTCDIKLVVQMVKIPPAMRETWVSIHGLGRSPGRGHGKTHSSFLAWRIPMDRGAWQATVHGPEKSRTQLSD